MSDPHFLVIIGSVRPQRIGPDVAGWVADVARSVAPAATFELVDLRDWPLAMDDEPGVPAQGGYTQPHTIAWSKKVEAADGFVFVTPQYNWGYPAALKNAIDHLYSEWHEKPAAIVTYGGHGGTKCAAQLREVLSGFEMKIEATMPALKLPGEQIEANSGTIDAAEAFADQEGAVRAAITGLMTLASSAAEGEDASAAE